MNGVCPGCDRRTYFPRRAGGVRERTPKGYLCAISMDGKCKSCWRAGAKRELADRRKLTDAEIRQSRVALLRYWNSRRRRGIPPGGADPETIHRGGLTLLEA